MIEEIVSFISCLPIKDREISLSLINQRDFESLQLLINSIIEKSNKNIDESISSFGECLIKLKYLVDEYCSNLLIDPIKDIEENNDLMYGYEEY